MLQKLEIQTYAQSEFIEVASVVARGTATKISWRFTASLATKILSYARRVLLVGIQQFDMVLFEGGKILGVKGLLLI